MIPRGWHVGLFPAALPQSELAARRLCRAGDRAAGSRPAPGDAGRTTRRLRGRHPARRDGAAAHHDRARGGEDRPQRPDRRGDGVQHPRRRRRDGGDRARGLRAARGGHHRIRRRRARTGASSPPSPSPNSARTDRAHAHAGRDAAVPVLRRHLQTPTAFTTTRATRPVARATRPWWSTAP